MDLTGNGHHKPFGDLNKPSVRPTNDSDSGRCHKLQRKEFLH